MGLAHLLIIRFSSRNKYRRSLYLSRKRWSMSRNFSIMWLRRISSFNRSSHKLILVRWSSMWTPSNRHPSRRSLRKLSSLSTIVRGRSRWWTFINRHNSSCRRYSTTQDGNYRFQRRPASSRLAVPIVRLRRNTTSQRRQNPLRWTRQCPFTPPPRFAHPRNHRSLSSKDRLNQAERQRQPPK